MLRNLQPKTPWPLPGWLSCFPEKLRCYSADDAFIAGWNSFMELHGKGTRLREQIWNLGSVLLKADCTFRGNGLRGIRFIEQHGFHICAVRELSFSRRGVEDLWRYSLGRLSAERLELLQRLQTRCSSLYMLVKSKAHVSRFPSSLQLTELKGQADPAIRHSASLRCVMGEPQSTFFNFVHTADEPADLVREVGLLFGEEERRSVILESALDARPDAEGAYEALQARSETSDLNFSCAVERLSSAVARSVGLANQERADCLDEVNRLPAAGYASWLKLREKLNLRGVVIREVDEIIIAAKLIPLKQAKPQQIFPSCEARHWERHDP